MDSARYFLVFLIICVTCMSLSVVSAEPVMTQKKLAEEEKRIAGMADSRALKAEVIKSGVESGLFEIDPNDHTGTVTIKMKKSEWEKYPKEKQAKILKAFSVDGSIYTGLKQYKVQMVLVDDESAKQQTTQSIIEGAFGKKLGESFDPNEAIGKNDLKSGEIMYQFLPEKPFRSLKDYFVLVTPKTNKIYAIFATGPIGSQQAAKAEQDLIVDILQKKYGKTDEQGFAEMLGDIKRISQGDRYISIGFSGIIDVDIWVRYVDHALRQSAEKERIELEGAKVDSGGL